MTADHADLSKRLREEPDDNGRGRIGAWAPGNYRCTCASCGSKFEGDKRALSCKPCAIIARYRKQRREAADALDLLTKSLAEADAALLVLEYLTGTSDHKKLPNYPSAALAAARARKGTPA